MSRWKCTKHDLEWETSKEDAKYPGECPWCMWEENDRLRKENATLREHRDALVKAIDIAQIVTQNAEAHQPEATKEES